jgi:hypothetical protein
MTTDTLIPNGQVIIFNFPAGAGGKMLQNCVGLSRYCVLNHADALSWQVNYTGEFDQAYYRKKQSWLMNTIPRTRHDMGNWLTYEIDHYNPHGFGFNGFQVHKTPVTNQNYYLAAEQGLWATITVHNSGAAGYYPAYWPTCQHVDLVNNRQFAARSLALKLPDQQYDQDWDTLGRTQGPCFEFDIDGTIWHPARFEAELRRLYDYLGFNDFPDQLGFNESDHVREALLGYYAQYINLHL